MNQEEINVIIAKQRQYFLTGETRNVNFRKQALKRLYNAIVENEHKIFEALKLDLGKGETESYMCEVGMTLSEISYMLKHLNKFASDKHVLTPLAQFASDSYTKASPYGVTLVMSPWNYPFMLTIDPLVDALAAGNTVVVKPSAYSPYTSNVIKEILESCFEEKYVAVVTGGRQENSCLLSSRFDKIFFTGSVNVGKEVMRKAAEYLIPITLELGGKSPCIIDKSAKLKLAARRLVFGKYLNCGQTCVAPDYVYVHKDVKDEFIKEVKYQIQTQFGYDPLSNENYGKIVNEKHFDRLLGLIDETKVVHGGHSNREQLRIAPTVMDNVTWDDPVMKEEIFGPIMPILTYDSTEELKEILQSQPHPLAFYLFSENKKTINTLMEECQFGGGCVNDTIIHLATSEMGFGGVGNSGMGSYHGKRGFDEFSYRKSVVDKKTWLDLPMRYQPYTKLNDKLIRIFMK